VEEAVKKVVHEMLSEKIDSLLTGAIEKAVAGEINRIKRLLMDEGGNGD
jgi:hypothetical protein